MPIVSKEYKDRLFCFLLFLLTDEMNLYEQQSTYRKTLFKEFNL